MTARPSLAPVEAMSAVQRLFYAVLPAPGVAAETHSQGQRLHDELGLRGRVVAAHRLHVTLHWLGDHGELPGDLVERAIAAGTGVEAAPFDVVFDAAGPLRGDGGLVVLTASRGAGSLRRFQRALAAAMIDAGIGRHVRSNFKPHVSLVYGDRQVERRTIAPLRWTVSELVLIHSVVGQSTHHVLGRWPLQTRQLNLGW